MTNGGMRQMDAAIWGRAEVQALSVTGDLFNSTHRFEHEGSWVEIRVPAVTLDEKLRPFADQRHIASYESGLAENPTRETNSYEINFLEASVELGAPLTIPQAMLEVSPKRPDIAGPVLSQQLDELSITYEGHLASAVSHWKAVVRWITGSQAIDTPSGLPGRAAEAVLQFQSLINLPDRKRFWIPTAVIAFQKHTELNSESWDKVNDALRAGLNVPIWSRFLDQAFRYLQQWDSIACVLSCAIACETLAKEINSLCPTQLDGTPNVHPAKKDPQMALIICDWEELTGVSDSTAHTVEVRELVKIRNDLMHSGGSKLSPDQATARRLFNATKKFVRIGEKLYHSKNGNADPRYSVV